MRKKATREIRGKMEQEKERGQVKVWKEGDRKSVSEREIKRETGRKDSKVKGQVLCRIQS